MDEQRWKDAMKASSRRRAPAPAETERFVRAVMGRLEPKPVPWLAALDRLIQQRWLVPALSVGLASVFFAIARQAQSPELDLEMLAGGPSAAIQLPALLAPEAP